MNQVVALLVASWAEESKAPALQQAYVAVIFLADGLVLEIVAVAHQAAAQEG